MNTFKKLYIFLKTNKTFFFIYIPVTAIIFSFGFLILRFPDISAQGVRAGISLNLKILIPSLFPFLFLTTFLMNSGIADKFGKLFSPLTEFLFKLSPVCSTVIIFSMIGGLPVGGKMTEKLYQSGKISQSEGQRLLLFAINPGPAFVISTVGHFMLKSTVSGIIIYVSLILSSLITGILSSFVWSEKGSYTHCLSIPENNSILTAAVTSLNESFKNMLIISAWIILFSCFIALIDILPLSDSGKLFLKCIFEVTNGCKTACKILPPSILCGIISFGGFCAQMQIFSAVLLLKLKIKYFFTARILCAGFSIFISNILFTIFPQTSQTILIGNTHLDEMYSFSLPLCVIMLIVSALLLLGDNYKISIKPFRENASKEKSAAKSTNAE